MAEAYEIIHILCCGMSKLVSVIETKADSSKLSWVSIGVGNH